MEIGCAPSIEVIVPNWNGIEVLPGCLRSLLRQTFRSLSITVVDNGSRDGSPQLVRDAFPMVGLLCLGENRGFCAAVNVALRRSKSPWCAVVNNDTELDPSCLEELYEATLRHPHAALFAPKILRYDDPTRIESAGDILRPDACGANRGRDETDRGQYDREEEVFSASAAAALYRRTLFDRVGFFDERFFVYFSDIDLGFRAQRFGFACVYVPQARVYHRGKFSGYGGRGWSLKQEFVNSTVCQVKNLPLRSLATHAGPIARSHLKSLKGLLKEGNARVLVEAEIELARRLPYALAQRMALSLRSRGRFDRLARFLPIREA